MLQNNKINLKTKTNLFKMKMDLQCKNKNKIKTKIQNLSKQLFKILYKLRKNRKNK